MSVVSFVRLLAVLVGVLLLAAATVGLHHATSGSDAWATSVEAVATVVLVGITVWYAYLTYKLISVQRQAPRAQSWEASLRELSRLMARWRQALWTATDFFPVDTTARPPMITDITDNRDVLKDVRNELLELVGLLPRDTAGSALGVAAHIVNAETELQALAAALLDETLLGLEEKRSWTWKGARAAHLATNDAERGEAWEDILKGRQVLAARERWDELSGNLDKELTTA